MEGLVKQVTQLLTDDVDEAFNVLVVHETVRIHPETKKTKHTGLNLKLGYYKPFTPFIETDLGFHRQMGYIHYGQFEIFEI